MPNLKLVEEETTDEKRRWRIKMQKGQLMAVAVRYVRDGKDGTMNDRLRTASDLSGIPRNLIEVEVKK